MHARPEPSADPAAATAAAVRAAMPSQGLFAGKHWLFTPQPFVLTVKEAREIEALGQRLHHFLRAANRIYHRSLKGSLPPWIARYLDAGKPPELLELARAAAVRDELPRVIRPDLILTEEGFAIAELDSVPGGIGLTAWLNRTYSEVAPQHPVVGGADGMLEGFRSVHPSGADIVISGEA
ncbi:MAG: hypothetical protein ACC661_02295, partial [Verrucomicrobiales bacterium]